MSTVNCIHATSSLTGNSKHSRLPSDSPFPSLRRNLMQSCSPETAARLTLGLVQNSSSAPDSATIPKRTPSAPSPTTRIGQDEAEVLLDTVEWSEASEGFFSGLSPKPHVLPPLNILFLVNGHGGMSQRMLTELQAGGHKVTVFVPKDGASIEGAAFSVDPDVILAPFLAKFVPESVYQSYTTIIVHPGPLGDGGPSSVDWAKRTLQTSWGVTLLEASDSWDGGPVWAHRLLDIPISDLDLTKSTLYRNYLIPAAVDAMWEALTKLVQGELPLVPSSATADNSCLHKTDGDLWLCPNTGASVPSLGNYQRKMTKKDRAVDFLTMSAAAVAHLIATSDSRPGATAKLEGVPGEVYLFNARLAQHSSDVKVLLMNATTKPGEVVGHRDGAVLVKCRDGEGVWVGSMMHKPAQERGHAGKDSIRCAPCKEFIKLPSHQMIEKAAPEVAATCPCLPGPDVTVPLPFGQRPLDTWHEIYLWQVDNVMFINFDFYNGAMGVSQCRRLKQVLHHVSCLHNIDAVILAGGRSFFSNGIHLNEIEASGNPEQASWDNIVAIDDVVQSMFQGVRNKLLISALNSNAGAGGVMMALAADLVWAQKDVVLNPHYKSMHLSGSEYWTHFLPSRVGPVMANKLTSACQPINAAQALSINLIDDVANCSIDDFHRGVLAHAKMILANGRAHTLVQRKVEERGSEWYEAAEFCRAHELEMMKKCFPLPGYEAARKAFVFKKSKPGEINVNPVLKPSVRHAAPRGLLHV